MRKINRILCIALALVTLIDCNFENWVGANGYNISFHKNTKGVTLTLENC